jgi:hypothetical protein
MSEYPRAKFYEEFACRTKVNLELVEKEARENSEVAFEATQLINSLYGLLVLPEQRYFEEINKFSDNEEEPKLFCEYKNRIDSTYNEVNSYITVFRHLRNVISHPHDPENNNNNEATLDIIPKQGKIAAVEFIDRNQSGDKYFKLTLEIDELKELIFEFCDIVIQKYSALDGR